jgi:HNH endonuclease
VIAHIPFSQLRGRDGASALEEGWIAARLGDSRFLTGTDAEAAACDALIVPVVTGHPDMTVIDQVIELVLTAAGHGRRGPGTDGDSSAPGAGTSGAPAAAALPPEDLAALRYRIARLAIDFVSGPPGIAALLRTRLLDGPFTTASLPLDIGYSENIPAHIRRAVALRDQGCAWPRCRRPAAVCDVHHIVHKKDGGKTSVRDCILLCQFHHDVCIHRWGWEIVLNPDGTTEARGPDGQILRSHAPPTLRAG